MMKVAIDLGACTPSGGGIDRYICSVLDELQAQASIDLHWLLYGRGDRLSALAFDKDRTSTRTDHLPVDTGRIASLFSSLSLWSAIDAPDLYWGPAHRLPIWLPKRTAKLVTIHDLCWLKEPDSMRAITRRLDAFFMPRALSMADKVITVSSETAHDLVQAFPHVAEKTVVIPLGVTALPSPQGRDALTCCQVQAPYILFVGTQEPRKNLSRLLQAYALTRASLAVCPELVIVGVPGWGNLKIKEECQQLGVQSAVKVLGRVDDAELSTLYKHAIFLAMPSLYEGFGLPLVEAMSHGKAVLTSDASSMPEVAGHAGLLVDPLSVESIANGLMRMLQDQELRTSLEGFAKQQAQRFTWYAAAEATLALMESVCRMKRTECLSH